jgi:acyl carrier protein
MDLEQIRAAVKQAIAKVSKINPATIADDAALQEDLSLDSLSVIEIIVEVQLRFKIPDPGDGELPRVRTVGDAVQLVQQHLCLGAV